MDQTTKLIFAAIAAGLWLNAGAMFLAPAHAQDSNPSFISNEITLIATEVIAIAAGTCHNNKIC
jgi:hypothetical protein